MDIINKNVSIWRGDNTPPTQYHLWQKGDVLFHHNGLEWVENKVPMASSNQNGLMSKEDKDKLDNLVCDSLESDRGDLALSAKQGKILLGKITDLNLSVYQPKGSVQNLADLPVDNLRVGDVYNIVNPFYIEDERYPAGTNVVWTGISWDPLGGIVDFSDYSTTEEVEALIEALRTSKVDKVEGKGLSTNDYTTDEKNKLAGIAAGAQVNVIESVKVNGATQSISNKEVNISVPTKLSQLTNDIYEVATSAEITAILN